MSSNFRIMLELLDTKSVEKGTLHVHKEKL